MMWQLEDGACDGGWQWCREVRVEEAAQLLPGGHEQLRQAEKPGVWHARKGHKEPIRHELVIAACHPYGLRIHLEEVHRVCRVVVPYGQHQLEIWWPLHSP